MPTKILIVDDDKELCEEITEILVDEGFNVETTHTGTEGLERMQRVKYDVLLLDLKLPGFNGFQVLKAARQMPVSPRIIVLTGRPLAADLPDELKTHQDTDEETLKLADAVFNKPFDIEILLGKITELSGNPS
jgi:DNA-binding response OmpR family regulator